MRLIIKLFIATAIILSGCKESQNKVLIDPVFDFKTVLSGDTVKATFNIKNATNKALAIEDVSSECDCIVPKIKSFNLNPGAEDKLEVFFITKGLNGVQQREVMVRTNNTPRFYRLKIKGEVRK